MDDVQAADVEGDGARGHADRAVHRVFGPGQFALQRRDAGRPAAQPQTHPPERVFPVQVPGRGRGRQQGGVHGVELVHEHERGIPDRGDLERRIAGGRLGARPQVHPGELIGHPPAHADAEQPGQPWRQRDLVGGAQAGQPARHDGHPVLPEVFSVEAAGHGGGGEGVVHPAVHHGIGGQAQPGTGGQHVGQALDLPDGGQERARDVDEHVAGVDRGQVAPVGRVRPPGPGQRAQRHRAEQPAHQRHHDDPAPGAEPGGPPVVKSRVHARYPRCGGPAGPLMRNILFWPRGFARAGRHHERRGWQHHHGVGDAGGSEPAAAVYLES